MQCIHSRWVPRRGLRVTELVIAELLMWLRVECSTPFLRKIRSREVAVQITALCLTLLEVCGEVRTQSPVTSYEPVYALELREGAGEE